MNKKNSKFKEVVDIINGIESNKFPKILQRILEKSHKKTITNIFSEEERKNLISELFSEQSKENEAKFNLLISSIYYIFEQSVSNVFSTEQLFLNLKEENGMNEEISKIFASSWKSLGKQYVEKLKEKSLGEHGIKKFEGLQKLKNIDWKLQINTGEKNVGLKNEQNAIFYFDIGRKKNEIENNDVEEEVEEEEKDKKIAVEFNKDELYKFLLKLEKIQNQLDQLMS